MDEIVSEKADRYIDIEKTFFLKKSNPNDD